MKRLDAPARGPKILSRPVDCTSNVCASNLQELKRETVKLLHHVEKLEALLLDKSTVTSDDLEFARHIRAEYMALGKTPNELQIKNLSKRLNKEWGGIDVEEDLDILFDEPLLAVEPDTPHPPLCPRGLVDLDSGSEIEDSQHLRNAPTALVGIEDDLDSESSDSDISMDGVEQALLAMETEPHRPPQYSRALKPPQSPPAGGATAAAADPPSPLSSPLSDTGLGDSD